MAGVAAAAKAGPRFSSLLTVCCFLGVASRLFLFLSFPLEVLPLADFLLALFFFLSSQGGCPQ